jgi:hypothetical protein
MVLSRHMPGGTEENHGKHHPGRDWNRAPPEHKSGALLGLLVCSSAGARIAELV